MSKIKNIIQDKILDLKRFLSDTKKASVLLSVLIVSLAIYFIVFADNTSYSYSIIDDDNSQVQVIDSAGNALGKNAIINSFDSITYTVPFKINEEISEEIDNISVHAYILIPKEYSANININNTDLNCVSNDNGCAVEDNYIKYHYSNASFSITSNLSLVFNLSNIYKKEETSNLLKPKIFISSTELSDFTGGYQDYSFTIKSSKKYSFQLFPGDKKVENNKTLFPLGVQTFIPYSDNENQKINGYEKINSIKYKLSIELKKLGESHQVADTDEKIYNEGNYNYINTNYISNSDFKVTDETKAPTTTVTHTGDLYKEITVEVNNIQFDLSNKVNGGIFISSNIFVFDVSDTDTIIYDIKATSIDISGEEKSVKGATSELSINDASTSINFPNNDKSLLYNKNFNFDVSIKYTSGSVSLSENNTYILFDENIQNVEPTNNYSYRENSDGSSELLTDDDEITVTKYYGQWTTNYFKLIDSRPSYCLNDLSSYSSDDLKKYYGVCITHNSNVTTTSSNNTNLIFLNVKSVLKDKFTSGHTFNIPLSATIKNDSSLINKELLISSVSIGSSEYLDNKYLIGRTANKNQEEFLCNEKITVIPIKARSTEIDTYNYVSDDKKTLSKQNQFYKDENEPIIWNINSEYEKSDDSLFVDKSEIVVELPKTLSNYNIFQIGEIYLDLNEQTEITEEKVIEKEIIASDKYTINDNILTIRLYNNQVDSFVKNGIYIETSLQPIARTSSDMKIKTNTKFISQDYSSNELIKESNDISIVVITSNVSSVGKLESNNKIVTAPIEKNTSYKYYMNSIINTSLDNISLIYPFPKSNDQSIFNGNYTVKLCDLPENYKGYYTNSKLNEETNFTDVIWNEITSETILNNENASAIKVEYTGNKIDDIPYYFGGDIDKIYVEITPSDNEYGDSYNNMFYAVTNAKLYLSKNLKLEIVNRKISGKIFEDYDFDGLYSEGEEILKDLNVELYKSNVDYITGVTTTDYNFDTDEKIKDILSNENGFEFSSLPTGKYYLKVTFNSEKYNITSYGIEDLSTGISSVVNNSKFIKTEEDNIAVSDLIELNDLTTNVKNINLGLKIKQSFEVNINKYIKSIKAIKPTGEELYEYDHEKEIKLDFKDLKNTTFEVIYGFDIKNTKYFPGYIGAIVEAIPDAMIFNQEENIGWEEIDGFLYYNGLSETLIMPDNTYSFEIKLHIPENTAGDFINIISVGDLRRLETSETEGTATLEDVISDMSKLK